MVSQNLHVGIKTITLFRYWYAVDISRWENLHKYTWVTIWVNTIANHIDTRTNLPRYKVPCILIDPNDIKTKKRSSNIHSLPISTIWFPLYKYSNGIKKSILVQYTLTFLWSPSLVSLLLLYPKTQGNGCPQFKSPSLLSHFPPWYHGGNTGRITSYHLPSF